jgi:hypothetical protein
MRERDYLLLREQVLELCVRRVPHGGGFKRLALDANEA